MVNDELVADIQNRIQQGQRNVEIRRDLIKNGRTPREIDEAMSYIQHLVLKQIPIVSYFINLWENFEVKVGNLPPRLAIAVLSGLAIFVVLVGIALYLYVDPMNAKSSGRDSQREEDFAEIKVGLGNYFSKNHVYPAALIELVPDYIPEVSKDPNSGREYDYRLIEGGNYELCITFETKEPLCVNSANPEAVSQSTLTEMSIPTVANLPTSSFFIIKGLVFMDSNNDKLRQTNERGTMSAMIHVADPDGKEVCKTETDELGVFKCNVGKPGTFFVLLDAGSSAEVLGVNPQKVDVPVSDNPEEMSVNMVMRTAVIYSSPTGSSAAPIQ